MNWYEKERSKLIHLLGGQCWMCGRTYKLEFHHADTEPPENRNGGKGNLLHAREIYHNGGRVWLLCIRCHTLIDPHRKTHPPGKQILCDTDAQSAERNLNTTENRNQKTTDAMARVI